MGLGSLFCLVLTDDGLFKGGVHRQDIFLHQLHRAGPLGDLLIEVVGQPGSLQLHLRGL